MLTLAEIVRTTNIDRSALNRYLAQADVRAALGGQQTHPAYPPESLPLFCRLAELHEKGEVKPKTLALRLKLDTARLEVSEQSEHIRIVRTLESEAEQTPDTEQALTLLPGQAISLLERFADVLAQRLAAQLLPPQEDRLIRSEEAARLLACSPRSVSRYVRPVRRSVWRRSDILTYIQSL